MAEAFLVAANAISWSLAPCLAHFLNRHPLLLLLFFCLFLFLSVIRLLMSVHSEVLGVSPQAHEHKSEPWSVPFPCPEQGFLENRSR